MTAYKFNNFDFSIDFNRAPISPTTTETRGVATSIARYGGTTVFCSVTVGDWAGFGSFLPLSVHYAERAYAVNKMPTGFIKRETKNRENEVLISRLIDRSIRSTIEESFRYKITVSLTVLSYVAGCPVEPLCITAASATLAAAGVPCTSIVSVKAGYAQGKWNFGSADHTVVISGNGYGLSTIETSGAPLPTEKLLGCIQFSLPTIIGLSDYIKAQVNKTKKLTHAPVPFENQSLSLDGRALVDAYYKNDLNSITKQANDFVAKWSNADLGKFKWNKLVRSALRSNMLWTNKRVDGRGMDDLRPLTIQGDFLQNNGSYLLTRGKTKVLTVPTVSGSNDSQTFETIDGNESRKFLLHYNYLLGDDRVSRRDIGHGNLARGSLKHFVGQDRFTRVVSEILDSDGSSSMTTVAGACLSLRAIGSMTEIIAGVSVGILLEGYSTRLLVDITALEDMISDMDLKIAGSKDGISAIQLDLKIPVLPWTVFENAILYGFERLRKVISGIKEQDPIVKVVSDKVHDSSPKKEYNKQIHKPKKDDEPIKENLVSEEVKQEQKEEVRIKQTSPDPKHADNKQKSKEKVSLTFDEGTITKITSSDLIDNLKKEVQADVYMKNNSFIFSGKNLVSSVNRFLTLLYDTGKEIYYGTVQNVNELEVEVMLLSGKACTIKLAQPDASLKRSSELCVYKGKFGRWTLHSILNY